MRSCQGCADRKDPGADGKGREAFCMAGYDGPGRKGHTESFPPHL